MYLDPAERRPPSALDPDRVPSSVWFAGAGLSLLAHIALPLAALVMAHTCSVVVPEPEPTAAAQEPEDNPQVVMASLVRRGRVSEDLPDRQVPELATAPPQPREAPSVRDNPPPPRVRRRPDAGVRQQHAVNDDLTRLADRARAFAEIARQREREGDPDGTGDVTTSGEGNRYFGRLYAFFRRGWTVPQTVNREVLSELNCQVDVAIGSDLTIGAVRVRRASGNALFDSSVTEQIERLRSAGSTVPPPPEEVAPRVLGRTITVRFFGRNAR